MTTTSTTQQRRLPPWIASIVTFLGLLVLAFRPDSSSIHRNLQQESPPNSAAAASSDAILRGPPLWSLSLNNSATYSPPPSIKELKEMYSSLDLQSDQLHARWTVVERPFFVSVHNENYDPVRWSIMNFGYYYEVLLTNCFYEVLLNVPENPRVLDVGGNIGWFTLVARSAGATVDVFEPNPANLQRLQESLSLNGWGYSLGSANATTDAKVHIHHAGVYQEDSFLPWKNNAENPGQTTIKLRGDSKEFDGLPRIPVYALDSFARKQGWFDTPISISILKVDVEGLEPRVFAGATQLLESRMIDNILMEITVRRHVHKRKNEPMLQLLHDSGYVLYKHGEYRGPNLLSNFSRGNSAELLEYCMNLKQMNLWWKKDTDSVLHPNQLQRSA